MPTTKQTVPSLMLALGLLGTACSDLVEEVMLPADTDGSETSTSGSGDDDGSSGSEGDGSGPFADDGCMPVTCEETQATCGMISNGCGGALECGTCSGTDACWAGACVPEEDLQHQRVDNPFAGAEFYVDPDFVAAIEGSIAQAPAELEPAMRVVQQQPTAVWLDRIGAIEPEEGRGLRDHLDEAIAQQMAAGPGTEMTIAIVVYDLPNRDCAAFASNGELVGAEGMDRYETEYIAEIAEIIGSDPRYQKLRVVAVIEPDSLPNAVTNLHLPACAEADPIYRQGVAHAISTLSTLDNVYLYLDIAHSGWLGWEHSDAAAEVYQDVLTMAGGASLVSGFITNVSNYSTLDEPFDPEDPAYQSLLEGYYEWNRVVDELAFVDRLRAQFPQHGFVIDTGRNGWPADGIPLEGRTHRGNWCNVDGAGIGERPQANPRPGQYGDSIHAFYWIKPPGESDGISDEEATDPNEEGKSYDEMCGPNAVFRDGATIPTDALDGAPHAGQWFHEQFVMLVQNANPSL